MAHRWSIRQAAAETGLRRATVHAIVDEGLVGPGLLDACDLVVLRAAAAVRTLLFPGESQPANTERSVRPRERQAAAAIRDLHGDGGNPAATLIVYADRVQVALDQGTLVTAALAAQATAETYLVLPIGSWLEQQAGAGKEAAMTGS